MSRTVLENVTIGSMAKRKIEWRFWVPPAVSILGMVGSGIGAYLSNSRDVASLNTAREYADKNVSGLGADLRNFQTEMRDSIGKLSGSMGQLGTDLRHELADTERRLREEMRAERVQLQSEMRSNREDFNARLKLIEARLFQIQLKNVTSAPDLPIGAAIVTSRPRDIGGELAAQLTIVGNHGPEAAFLVRTDGYQDEKLAGAILLIAQGSAERVGRVSHDLLQQPMGTADAERIAAWPPGTFVLEGPKPNIKEVAERVLQGRIVRQIPLKAPYPDGRIHTLAGLLDELRRHPGDYGLAAK